MFQDANGKRLHTPRWHTALRGRAKAAWAPTGAGQSICAAGHNESVTRSGETFYEAVGGADTFEKLVHRFYTEVKSDEVLRPLYPEEDLEHAERRLRMFLEQYWGGPQTYSAERGHPRLRMRHIPFKVGPIERDAWLRCMHTAIAAIDDDTVDGPHRKALIDYFEMAANSLVNSPL